MLVNADLGRPLGKIGSVGSASSPHRRSSRNLPLSRHGSLRDCLLSRERLVLQSVLACPACSARAPHCGSKVDIHLGLYAQT